MTTVVSTAEPAGASQLRLARRAKAEAAEYARLLEDAQRQYRRHRAAGVSEQRVFRLLAAMESLGWRTLADRKWPGTRAANVDFLHVGPGGVLVVDVKNWAEPEVVDGRLQRGQEDAQDDVDKLLRIADLVEESTADIGLAPSQVVPVLVFAGRSLQARIGRVVLLGEQDVVPWVNRLGGALTAEQVREVADVLDRDFAPYEDPGAVEDPPQLPVVVPLPETAAQGEQLALPTLQDVEQSLLDRAYSTSVEEWMTFLHPAQVKVVRQSRNGPARLRGPAGTGKTVIGLHRAAYLAARRPGQVLVVSFVRTLPTVLEGLFARLAPEHAGKVVFTGLHRWASTFLADRGVAARVDGTRADTCFSRAWMAVGRDKLGDVEGVGYWKDEVCKIIKGRGLTEFEQYRALRRVGRSTRLDAAQREAVWELYVAYTVFLREAGVRDFDDLLLLALDEVRRRPLDPPFSAVVVDEVQDLSRVGVQLLHALAGDGPDALTLIGDGQQSVYPGGFTLAEAGVNVRGRSTVLRTNYRNARDVLQAALDVISADEFSDLDDDLQIGQRDVDTARAGGVVVRVDAADGRSLDAALTSALKRIPEDGVGLSDCPVLAATTKEANRLAGVLRRAGLPVVPLEDYAGRPVDAVKVGTIKRSKGLEFWAVFLPCAQEQPPPRRAEESDEAHRDRCALHRRELFVGMTRARDRLWLGRLNP
ncbi:nuclease-related domain-containing DEAD/DEAH box helicase [Kineococcus sp. SYSU DK004]|uniref:nuclease-related domain-containing DEAD/DEAH box helicase n=1 Tax=Kineococcus sp. SYSU DK004 TaxID=3383125 RepID=UPI003D7DFF29